MGLQQRGNWLRHKLKGKGLIKLIDDYKCECYFNTALYIFICGVIHVYVKVNILIHVYKELGINFSTTIYGIAVGHL